MPDMGNDAVEPSGVDPPNEEDRDAWNLYWSEQNVERMERQQDDVRPERRAHFDRWLEYHRAEAARLRERIATADSRPPGLLTFSGQDVVPMPWHHFVDIKTFVATDRADDAVLLAGLLEHDEYQDGYIGGPGLGRGIHGQYLVSMMSVESFERVPVAAALTAVEGWVAIASDRDPPEEWPDYARASMMVPPGTDTLLRDQVYDPLRQADSIYQLRDLPEAPDPPGVPTWRENGFHEFVAIKRSPTVQSVVLIVCTDD
jgi:hypothetical protein